MKRKLVLIILLAIAAIVFLTGCKSNNRFKLEIKESSWSGWSENYKPEETTNDYDVFLDREYSIDSGGLTFVIKEINKDNIVIETTEPFSDKEEGIDLFTKKTEFTIYLDKEIELTTPTMDAGDIYYLKLKK